MQHALYLRRRRIRAFVCVQLYDIVILGLFPCHIGYNFAYVIFPIHDINNHAPFSVCEFVLRHNIYKKFIFHSILSESNTANIDW